MAWTLMGALILSGCVVPVQRSLTEGSLPRLDIGRHEVRIEKIEVVDQRDPMELSELRPQLEYFVPLWLLLTHFQSSVGPVRPPAELYSLDPTGEFESVVKTALQKSGLQADDAAAVPLTLKVRLTHLYGITHMESSLFWVFSSAVSVQRTFAPYGYAAAEIELLESGGRTLGTRAVYGYFDPNLMDTLQSGPIGVMSVPDKLTAAAVSAANDLAANIVRAVETLVGDYPLVPPIDMANVSVFYLARPTADGQHLEVAGVRIDTGEIISDSISRRWMEPYSGVNEWVVDPYHGGQRRLSDEQYRALVQRLQERYNVAFVDNVRVARFMGAKAGP